ncbi:PKD domain-containing protein [Actinotalea sp. AC32]|nr:PKD domain-containing protein [Actinotalea sp. AC32]
MHRRTSALTAVAALVLSLVGTGTATAAPAPVASPAATPVALATAAPKDYVALTPSRVLTDSAVPAGTVRCIQVGGRAGVPTGAAGVYVNVTTVRPAGPGNVLVYPDSDGTGRTPAPKGSTVNFETGADVANSTFVRLPANGKVCYATQGPRSVGVLIDVAGYMPAGSSIVTQASQRLLDTRSTSRVGSVAGPVQPRKTYTVRVAGKAGVPTGATAAIVNVTVTGPRAGGNLRVWPGAQPLTKTSLINFAPGQDKANGAIVQLSSAGDLSFYADTGASSSQSPVQVIIDVVGYVEADAVYSPVTPTRLVDTRSGSRIGEIAGPLKAGAVSSFLVEGKASVPSDASAVVLNVTAVGASTRGNLRVYPDVDGTRRTSPPFASNINYVPGRDIPNMVVAALPANGRVNVYSDQPSGGTVQLVVDVVGYVRDAGGLTDAPAPGDGGSGGDFTLSAAARALTPDTGVLFGAAVSRGSHPDMDTAISAFERMVDRKLDVHRTYSQWDEPAPGNTVTDTVARGRTPVHSIAPKLVNGTRLSWASIAAGKHDTKIREHARAIKALGVPIFLTFQHEPELALAHGTPAEYRAAWRHYVSVYRSEGVQNVVWTWIVTPTVFGANATVTADQLYPGDDVVDYISMNAYNWFGCSTNNSYTSWRSMEYLSQNFRAYGKAHAKPLMVAEYGSNEDASQPGRKGAWLRETMDSFTSWPEMKAVLYFNVHGSCPWFVESSPSSLAAFTEIGDRPSAHRRAQAWLSASKTHGPAPLAVTFTGSGSTGMNATTGTGIASWTLDLGDGSARKSGTGQPPASVAHSYRTGTFKARLTVTDTGGRTATDTVTIVSAPAPTVRAEAKDVTSSTATLVGYADMHGFAGTMTFEWGRTEQYGNKSQPIAVPLVSYEKTIRHAITGLRAGTDYYVRVTTTSPAGTTVTKATFGTQGPPTTSKTFTTDQTSTSVQFNAQVDPHRLATDAWIEWGTAPDRLTNKAPVVRLPAVGYEMTVRSGVVTGLEPGASYYYRVVARNALGSVTGPVAKKTMAWS